MPKAAVLIPASPTGAFLSQLAVFTTALRKQKWSRWEPSVLVCMGGEPDRDALEEWLPYLGDATFVFAPAEDSNSIPFYYAQIDGLYRWAPRDADVFLRMDADTLLVGDIEDVLDHVIETNSIAGVMAHIPFPTWPGMTSRDAWLHAAKGLTKEPLDFRQAYSFVGPDVPEEDRVCPFYVNDGAVFLPKALFDEFTGHFLNFRPRVMDRLARPYYAGQVALTLAVTEMRARTCALPMRYNFPNDEIASKRFPEELNHVKIFHYLRYTEFDRQVIFANSTSYQTFVRSCLTGVNKVFQEAVLKILGPVFPFSHVATRLDSLPSPTSRAADATGLSREKWPIETAFTESAASENP